QLHVPFDAAGRRDGEVEQPRDLLDARRDDDGGSDGDVRKHGVLRAACGLAFVRPFRTLSRKRRVAQLTIAPPVNPSALKRCNNSTCCDSSPHSICTRKRSGGDASSSLCSTAFWAVSSSWTSICHSLRSDSDSVWSDAVST